VTRRRGDGRLRSRPPRHPPLRHRHADRGRLLADPRVRALIPSERGGKVPQPRSPPTPPPRSRARARRRLSRCTSPSPSISRRLSATIATLIGPLRAALIRAIRGLGLTGSSLLKDALWVRRCTCTSAYVVPWRWHSRTRVLKQHRRFSDACALRLANCQARQTLIHSQLRRARRSITATALHSGNRHDHGVAPKLFP
jgi:hypothetical protein